MNIEFFHELGRGYSPKVSIRREGQLGFNQGAVTRFGLEQWKFCVLGYDRDERVVAIKLTNDENEKGSRPIRGKKGGTSVSAKAFLDYFAIPHGDTKRFDLRQDETTGYLLIDLKTSETSEPEETPEMTETL